MAFFSPSVGVGDHECDPREPVGHQAPQERRPARPVLGAEHVEAQDLAVAVGVDPGGDDRGHRDHPAALSHLVEQGVEPQVGVGPGVEGPVGNSATLASRFLASSETWDLDIPSIPMARTRSSTRRVETPST